MQGSDSGLRFSYLLRENIKRMIVIHQEGEGNYGSVN